MKVAYLMSRFPKLTETFILYEMLAVEQQGVTVTLYPLLREKTAQMHPESAAFVQRAKYTPFISWSILRANLSFAARKPRAYFGALYAVMRANWGSLRYFMGALAFFPKSIYFAQEMVKDRVNHIHAHFASHPAAAAYIIHRITGIPYSFTAHGSDIHRDRHMLAEKVAHADFVVPISSFNRQVILDECAGRYAEKLFVIHCGVDTQFFHSKGDRQGKQVEMTYSILCIGTLHEVKGQIHLIQACQQLARHGTPFICRFLGDGPDRQALEAYVKQAGLEGCVEFLGQRTRTEVIAQLQAASVLVAPSVPSRDGRREGIPVVLMEAMASGVPVVASRLSGIPELIQHGKEGLLVPPGDPVALAEALETLFKDENLRHTLSLEARNKVEQEFNLTSNASRLIHLFRKEAKVWA